MRHVTLLLLGVATTVTTHAQPKTDSTLSQILKSNTHPVMQQVLADPQTYRCQIVYTRIDRDKNNTPTFTPSYFNYDPELYFNPASTVKLPLALLALEKLNDMKQKGVTKYTTIQYDSSYTRQIAAYADSTSANELPSIAHYIKRAFLISENDPYNRLYQFVGQQTIHRSLHSKGYTGVRIPRQFMGYTPEQNRHSNQVRFIDAKGKTIYLQPAAYNTDSIDFSRTILLGKAHFNRDDSLIQAPFDFTLHNNLSLMDLQQMLQSVLFPNSVPKHQRFRLTQDDYRFLYRWLSQYPSETDYPKYDTSLFYDSYVKFFFRDSTHRMPSHIRIFNKVGWSYGFLTDISYVMDTKNKVEYMLAATLYVNSDGVLNDSKYDYDTIGYPFLYQLGQTIYQHELQRKRTFKPNISQLQVTYDKRNPNDTRPALKEVDN
jgi:hypothetical protein